MGPIDPAGNRSARRTRGRGEADGPRLLRSVIVLERVDVGEQQQRVRVQCAGQQRRGQVLVDHGLGAPQEPGRIARDGHAAAARADHDRAGAHQLADQRQVKELSRLGEGTTRRQALPSRRTCQPYSAASWRALASA